jgi:glucose 1-dehydrogenase
VRLKDQVAIVTGAGKGIGRALASGLAREGARVVLNFPPRERHPADLVREIRAIGADAVAVQGDVSDLSHHEGLVSAALESFGRLDILVNNAAVQFREPFLRATADAWDATIGVNLKGAYFLSQKAAGLMARSGKGKIINVSSVHDTVPLRDRSAYTISKGGMLLLTKSLALELAEYKINVNAISPGAILTDMNREHLSEAENRSSLLKAIPLNRIGEVEDIVGAAVFLASPESDYVTGTTIYVDGGLLLRPT